MRATRLEFRLRMMIQIVIVLLGFWAPWIGSLDLGRRVSLLEWLPLEISRTGLLRFSYASAVVIVLGALFALAGAVLRVWGAASLGYQTVHHGDMQGSALMADGPYRFMRNPLYLGGWCTMVAFSLLMPPSGALFSVVLIAVHFLRLILGEEAFLSAKLGDSYRSYLAAVPRLFPRLRAALPPSGSKPHWLIAVVTEIIPIAIFVAIAFLSWTFDNLLMIKTVVITFGISLVVRAVAMRKTKPE